MFRHTGLLIIGAVAVANLNAGSVQIQIGGNTGLTSSYASATSTAPTPYGELMYTQNLLQGASGIAETSGSLCAGATVGTCTPTTGTPAGAPNDEFATANGVTFALLNQSASNEWGAGNGAGVSTITIPIGIFGVTNVDTMINDEFGVGSSAYTTVQFQFSNSSNNLTFTLYEGTVISDDFDCTAGVGSGAAAALAACQAYNFNYGLNTTNMYGTSGSSLGLIAPTSTPNVTAFNVWSGTYSNGTGAYLNTSGNLYLDAQDFYLGSNSPGLLLEDVVITNTATAAKQTRDGLSAVTVFTSAPEPSTVFLVLTGIGAVALFRRRRNA
jgi:hypothetical protein